MKYLLILSSFALAAQLFFLGEFFSSLEAINLFLAFLLSGIFYYFGSIHHIKKTEYTGELGSVFYSISLSSVPFVFGVAIFNFFYHENLLIALLTTAGLNVLTLIGSIFLLNRKYKKDMRMFRRF
ncbi:hypothetical protein [Flexithrix dorotheae]|uniref:hypothetical protein n=1 Tax=Flexithrix dorotheae TaxID=70993 RepID=UPI000370D6B6|nr:hypothetical protein [Flexithrix dorotheae]